MRTGRPEGARWLQPEDVSHFLSRSNTQTVTPTLIVPNTLYTSDLSAATTARCLLLPSALLYAPLGLVLHTRKREPGGTGPGAAKSRSSFKPSFFLPRFFYCVKRTKPSLVQLVLMCKGRETELGIKNKSCNIFRVSFPRCLTVNPVAGGVSKGRQVRTREVLILILFH